MGSAIAEHFIRGGYETFGHDPSSAAAERFAADGESPSTVVRRRPVSTP
jgi:3-hydroxyisobutyrate dehydrogenase-like beta-hydroxyacid dehydrogenase